MRSRIGDDQQMMALLKRIINIPSPTGHETKLGLFLEEFLGQMRLSVRRQQLEGDRFNLLATAGAQAKVLLCTHMDTILPHLGYSRDEEIIRGRGACDAKGAMAAMISASGRLQDMGIRHFGVLLVCGEEGQSDGAKKAAQMKLRTKYLILGEPTDNKAAWAQKGTLVFRVTVRGKAAHSACPAEGSSAVHHLAGLIAEWTRRDWGRDQLMGLNSLNVGRIEGGVGANVIAPSASAEGIFRIASGGAILKEELLSFAGPTVEIEIRSESEPMKLFVPAGLPTTVVSFGSDAPHLRPLGEIVLLGPGCIEFAHSPDEQIRVNELVRARDLYVSLVQRLG